METKRISDLAAASALDGTELIELEQSGGSVQSTVNAALGVKITNPVAWTPTFTGFGTVSGVTAYSWRVGMELFFEVRFVTGTTTATEARISMGYNGTDGNVTSASTYPALNYCGSCITDSGAALYTVLIETSKTYATFGIVNSNGLIKQNADAIMGAGQTVSLKGSIRIQGW